MKRIGFWWRVLATLVDLPVAIVLWIGVTFAVYTLTGGLREPQVSTAFWTTWLCYTSLEVFTAGTPGKRLLKMRISTLDGTPADRWRLLVRWFAKQTPPIFGLCWLTTGITIFYFLAGISNAVLLLSCLYASGESKLAWHDEWAGTAVTAVPDKSAHGLMPFTTPPPLPPLK